MIYTVSDIRYETDGIDIDLPESLDINVPDNLEDDEVQDYLGDEISNITGFCHDGFTYDLKK